MKLVGGVIVAIAAIVGLAFGVRAFLHASTSSVAVLTPSMNAHRALSEGVAPRVYRVLHEPVEPLSGKRDKLIALTFDDGPYPVFTPLLLDELRALHVPATFFLIGRDAEEWPALATRIEADGDEIGDHTYSHPDLDHESPAQVRHEILEGRDVLWQLTHDPSVAWMMRPPHGRYTEQTLRVAQSIGYHVILWTDDSGDWRTVPTSRIVAHVEHYATQPDIVLMHSGKIATIEALPAIVRAFEKAGYRFVTVGELLQRVGPEAVNHPLRRSV